MRRTAFAILLATFAAVLCWGLSPRIARADSDESRGYWKFYKSTITEDGVEPFVVAGAYDGVGYERGAYTRWECAHGKYTVQFVVNEDIYHTESSDLALAAGDRATSVATYDVPKESYRDTDVFAMNYDLSCDAVKRDVMLDLFEDLKINPWVEYGTLYTDDDGEEQFSVRETTWLFNADGEDCVVTDIDHPNASGTFTCKLGSGSDMRIIVEIRRLRAEYWYRWVDDPVEETPPTEKIDIVIDTDATEEKGSWGGWVIPAAIVGVSAIVGGTALALSKRKGGNDPEPDDPPTFRMVLWKDFGDTLYVGGGKQVVGARIEEERPGGGVVVRDDLTGRISFLVSVNCAAEHAGMQAGYKCINVEAVQANAPGTVTPAIVTAGFEGKGGSFTVNVRFEVEELALDFPDVPLTFVAGKGQTFTMPFGFNKEEIGEGLKPTNFRARLTSPAAEKRFRHARVIHDPDFPERYFAVEMTECGPVGKDDVPGSMESFVCEVTATLPVSGRGPVTLVGGFTFFRFFEGVRFTCEPLKCYLEMAERKAPARALESIRRSAAAQAAERFPDDDDARRELRETLEETMVSAYYDEYLDEGEVVVSGRNVIHGAASMAAASLGQAGGMALPGAEWAFEEAIRETAREAKEMFPELFERTTSYLLATRDRMRCTPGRTHAYLTLFVVDEFTDERGRRFLRPCTPLPAREGISLTFDDVPGSSTLHDEKGRIVERPAEKLDFRYFVKDVKREDNTVELEVLPTKAIMRPPNRAEVDVRLAVRWAGRDGEERLFAAEQRVCAISQPLRVDYLDRSEEYDAEDAEVLKVLRGIQDVIDGKWRGQLAAEPSFSVGEAAADVLEGAIDNPVFAANPYTSSAAALYYLYKSIRRQNARPKVYYDDLTPLSHFIETLIQGHDGHFGYDMPTVKFIVAAFARYENGEVGAAQAIEIAQHGAGTGLYEALGMTVREWNRSWAVLGLRIIGGIATLGTSEYVFIPLNALSSGIEASCDYIDRGGDNALEVFRVGVDRGLKEGLKEVAIMAGVKAAVTGAGVAYKCTKVLAKEAWAQRQLIRQALGEMRLFSTAQYATRVKAVSDGLYKQMLRCDMEAIDHIARYGGAQALQDEIDATVGYLWGRTKVDTMNKLLTNGELVLNGRPLTLLEQRAVVLSIQCDKNAMSMLRAGVEAGDERLQDVCKAFNRIMGSMKEDALKEAAARLSRQMGGVRIRVVGTSGNDAEAVRRGTKLPTDMDATFQYWDDAAREWKDVRYALGQQAFDREFYKAAKGVYADRRLMADLARRADMTITDMFHPEAYSRDYEDVARILDASRAGEPLTDPKLVAKAARYKCDHWLRMANDLMERGRALAEELGPNAPASAEYAQMMYDAQSFVEEAIRQYTKQADRIIVTRIAKLRVLGVPIRTSVSVDGFLAKASLMKQCGVGRFGGWGLTPAQVRVVLRQAHNSTLEQCFAELETLTVELDALIRASVTAA